MCSRAVTCYIQLSVYRPTSLSLDERLIEELGDDREVIGWVNRNLLIVIFLGLLTHQWRKKCACHSL